MELPSSEFSRIIREMSHLTETVVIKTTKNSITFSINGDIGQGEIMLKENNVDKESERVVIDVDEEVEQSFSL